MYSDYPLGCLFARFGMAGWWKDSYATMPRKEVGADLRERGAPASPLFIHLGRDESRGREESSKVL